MKIRTLIINAIIAIFVTACSNNVDTMDARNTTSTDKAESLHDARDVAEDFVGHINYARIAIARNQVDLAELQIAEARYLLDKIQDITIEDRKIAKIEYGRVVYKYNTDYQYHYFPIEMGPMEVTKYKYHYFPVEKDPMEVKTIQHGPLWAKNNFKVTDADIIYLTVDLSGNKAAKRLAEAEAGIRKGNLKAADVQLLQLTDEVVSVDDKTSIPVDKARDNIALAHNFISAGNFTSAGYALKHASTALNFIQKDNPYAIPQEDIDIMRHDVVNMKHAITKKTPIIVSQANTDTDSDSLWSELENLSNNQ